MQKQKRAVNHRKKPIHHKTSSHQTGKGKGEIRIIAGKWRGRKLPVLNHQGLRPTTDRVKETLFNWLMPYIVDSHCLDCFAGSGSLGFEALSRQAQSVQFFELDHQVAKQLQVNLERLLHNSQCINANVQQGDSLQLLQQGNSQPPYDIIFLDPPFHKNLLQPALELLNDPQWLTDGALIYIEKERSLTFTMPTNWQLLKEKNAGEVSFNLYRYNSK